MASILGYVVKILDFGSVVAPGAPVIRQSIRIGAQAGIALFRKALRGNGPLAIQVGEGPPVECTGSLTNDLVNSGPWIFGFYYAVLCHERPIIDALCQIPTDLFEQSSSKAPAYHSLFVEALKAFWARNDAADTRIQAAVDATAAVQDFFDPEMERLLLVPQVDLLASLHFRPHHFNETLAKALILHREFFDPSNGHTDVPGGFVAFRLLALAALASSRGVVIEVESDYLPTPFILGKFDCT